MLIYSFCRYSLCLSQGSRAVFTRRRLFSQSKSNLLLGLVMGTDVKITESRECTDIVRADWGQTEYVAHKLMQKNNAGMRDEEFLCCVFVSVEAWVARVGHQCTESAD